MEEREDKVVLTIEEANTKVLEIVNNAVVLGWDKEFCKQEVLKLVNDTKEQLQELGASDELVLNTQNSIMATFMNSWITTMQVLKENAKKDKIGLIANTLLSMESKAQKDITDKGLIVGVFDDKVGIGKGSIKNLRDFVTANESLGASQRYVEYTDRIKNTLNEINERLANNTMTLTGSDGRKLSVRNLAEIETRYKLISEDLKRNGVEVNDFVIASSHQDASERCSWWQGKIFTG
jgi:ABC-type sugar transport system ATPase subunit